MEKALWIFNEVESGYNQTEMIVKTAKAGKWR
jgi:hypothetical protein